MTNHYSDSRAMDKELGREISKNSRDRGSPLEILKSAAKRSSGDLVATSIENALNIIAKQDVEGLLWAQRTYGDSWKKRGGIGAFFVTWRKVDRLEQLLKESLQLSEGRIIAAYDVFARMQREAEADISDAVLDSVRDLRRYLMLWEAEMILRGVNLPLQRDNKEAGEAVRSDGAK